MEKIRVTDLDWYKNKDMSVRGHGNLALLASAVVKNNEIVSTKTRCVWPLTGRYSESRFLTRKLDSSRI